MKHLMILVIWVMLSSHAFAETNCFAEMNRLPRDERRAYLLSLSENSVLRLANEAHRNGWDNYAVNAGILAEYYGSKEIQFTAATKLAVMKDRSMHPSFRANMASRGLLRSERSSPVNVYLDYVDEVIDFFEDGTIEYFWKQGIPASIREELQRKMNNIQKEPARESKTDDLDKVYRRGLRMLDSLVLYLKENPKPSKDREDYSSSSFAVASLSEYVQWFLNEATATTGIRQQQRANAICKAQSVLIAILDDPEYDPVAARAVLRSAKDSGIDRELSAEMVAKIKKDKRFSGEEDQRLLDMMHQRVRGSR